MSVLVRESSHVLQISSNSLQNLEIKNSEITYLSNLFQSRNVLPNSPLFHNLIFDTLIRVRNIYSPACRKDKKLLKDTYANIHFLLLAPELCAHQGKTQQSSLPYLKKYDVRELERGLMDENCLQFELSIQAIKYLMKFFKEKKYKQNDLGIIHEDVKHVQGNVRLIKKLVKLPGSCHILLNETPIRDIPELKECGTVTFDCFSYREIIKGLSKRIFKKNGCKKDPALRSLEKGVKVLADLHQKDSISLEEYISATVDVNESLSMNMRQSNNKKHTLLNASMLKIYKRSAEFYKDDLIKKIACS